MMQCTVPEGDKTGDMRLMQLSINSPRSLGNL